MSSQHKHDYGIILKTIRELYDYTQKEVSTYLHISVQAYSNYETGKRTPDVNTMVRLTQFYNITLDQLLSVSPTNGIADGVVEQVQSNPIHRRVLPLSKTDIKLLSNFNKLTEEDRKEVLEFIRFKARNP